MSMTPDEMIAVIEAHKAGKRIEYKNSDPARDHGWIACDDPCWQFLDTDYRVAPDEPPKPPDSMLDSEHIEIVGPATTFSACTTKGIAAVWLANADTKDWRVALRPADSGPYSPHIDYANCVAYPIRRRAPKVIPWTIDTVPMPLVVRIPHDGSYVQVAHFTRMGVMLCGASQSIPYAELHRLYLQRDGSACGTVEGAK